MNGYRLGDAILGACNRGFETVEKWHRSWGRRPVENLSTKEVQEAISCVDSRVVLVDVRSDKERGISRIEGSITVEEYELNPQRFLGKTIVPYCTVGGRSYLYARRLANAGIETRNYREGILGWCRDGLPLISRDGQPTYNVHTYWQIFRLPNQYGFQSEPDEPQSRS